MNLHRSNGRIDINKGISDGSILVNEEERRGARSNKFWFNDYMYMYKDVYQKTYEDYGEIIAYELAKKLGIECAEYDFAIFNGNNGVVTKNLIDDNNNKELISGTEVITRVYSEYIVPILICRDNINEIKETYNARSIEEFKKLPPEMQITVKNELVNALSEVNIPNINQLVEKHSSNEINYDDMTELYGIIEEMSILYNDDFIEMKNGIIKSNNIYDIWTVIEIYSQINNYEFDKELFMNNLIKMLIFDIITSQGDRHADNWSIIVDSETNSFSLAPLYDNSGMCCLGREKAIKNIVGYVEEINNPALHSKKKEKLIDLLFSTISHNNSGLKIDYDDVIKKNKNAAMVKKFMHDSSSEFNEMMLNMAKSIDENVLDDIFESIESTVKIPEEVKTVVKNVIHTNIEMIKKIYGEMEVKYYG